MVVLASQEPLGPCSRCFQRRQDRVGSHQTLGQTSGSPRPLPHPKWLVVSEYSQVDFKFPTPHPHRKLTHPGHPQALWEAAWSRLWGPVRKGGVRPQVELAG